MNPQATEQPSPTTTAVRDARVRPAWGSAVLAMLLVVGAGVAGAVDRPTVRQPVTATADVVGATAVCPDLRQIRDTMQTRVTAGAAPAGRTSSEGKVTQSRVTGQAAPQALPLREAGQVAVGVGTAVNNDGLILTATGGLAAGLEVEAVTRGEEGGDRGLAGVRCDAPRQEAWFVGGGTGLSDATRLILANVEDTPSTVDVNVLTPNGYADPRPGQGITIQPHARVGVDLDTLAPDQVRVAVHVTTRRGRVAAALRHARRVDGIPFGVDWVPQSISPSRVVVVPGFPQGPGDRLVLLANPGQDDTTVSLRVTTNDGQFVPSGMDAVEVAAGSIKAVFVSALTASSPMSVTVTSDGPPVLAGGLVYDQQPESGSVRELSYTAGTLPLSGPSLMTDLVIDRPTESTLLLTATEERARVLVTPIRVLGTVGALPAPRTLVIPAGRTIAFKLSTFYPPGTATRLAVEVRPVPGSGPLYVARYLRERGAHGPLTTLLDLQGPAQQVPRPAVLDDPAVVGGR